MIRVHFPRRKSVTSQQPDFSISYYDLSMTVNIDRLPSDLYKRLPKVLSQAKEADWVPFCIAAVASRLMR